MAGASSSRRAAARANGFAALRVERATVLARPNRSRCTALLPPTNAERYGAGRHVAPGTISTVTSRAPGAASTVSSVAHGADVTAPLTTVAV